METKLKIIMVDDNVPFRTNLKIYIESKLGYRVIAEASNGLDFLALPNIGIADIILMDIVMDEMDGIEATKRILWNRSYLKIIAITMHTEKIYLLQLVETGFKGCVFKSNIYDQLDDAIKTVLSGKLFIPDNIPIDK
jgi:DNA-binding NarL/FixJ family response regulator